MKQKLQSLKNRYSAQIAHAKANQFEAVMIPLNSEYDLMCLNNIDDMEYIYDLAMESGWEKILLIDLIDNKEHFINLYELDVA